jgi:hypothetical protein
MTGQQITARRWARDLAYDLRWRGVAIAPLYTRMTRAFLLLVESGEYDEWVAATGRQRRDR